MNANSKIWVGAGLIAMLAMTGCREHDIDRGRMVNETRDVGEFTSISLRGSAELQVKIGAERSVAIEGPERTLKRLATEVNDNTLYIHTSNREWVFPGGGNQRLLIKVTTPQLSELRIEGGNDVRLQGFNGGRSMIDIEGAAHLKADGRLDDLIVHMAGAGHADLKNLVAGNATVTVDGVGSVYVNSTNTLDATMNGVGAILYSGSPREVNTSMNGVGTISRDRDRKHGEDDEDSDEEPDVEAPEPPQPPKPPLDPEKLQPEYEKTDVVETSGVV